MAFTIVRTVGKLATFPWRPATVTAEPKSFQVQIDCDPRLAAAAGGVARYVSESAGLECSENFQFQKAVVAACIEAFKLLGGSHPHVTVTTTRFTDRIEVELTYQPKSQATKDLDGSAGPRKAANNSAFEGIDQTQRQVREGTATTRLTKYLRTAPSKK